jgi:ribonuclease P protein component
MLPKSKRLKRDHFKNLLTSRRFFHTAHFTLRLAESEFGPKIGVSVSKKVAKRANLRNRTRRRVYAAIRDLNLPLEGRLYLIVAKAKAETLKGENLKQELAELLKKG